MDKGGEVVEMTISQMKSVSQIGPAKLLVIAMAVLMIAAVACSSGEKTTQPDAPATGANAAGSNAATTSDQGQTANTDSGGSSSIAPVAPEAAAPEATVDAEVEQAIGALFLEMISPDSNELFVTQSSFEFSGRTTVDALLSVNDHVLEVDEQGHFTLNMDLEEGPNVVEVVASNALGEQFDEVLLVIYEPA